MAQDSPDDGAPKRTITIAQQALQRTKEGYGGRIKSSHSLAIVEAEANKELTTEK